MAERKPDSNNYWVQSNESAEDMAAKGGPSTGLGTPDARHPVSKPYDADLQTQIAAKGKIKKDNSEKA